MLYKAADARDLRNAGDAFEAQFNDIILNGAQFGKIMAACLINDSIGKPPAKARRIGTKDGIHISGNFIFHSLQIFQHPASRPVDIRPFLENYVDEGTTEIGKPSDSLYLRGGKEGGGNGIGDLVFHQIGASACPFSVDNDLGIAQIRKGIEGRIL